MNHQQALIYEEASRELEDMLDALERFGPAYQRDYIAWLTEGKPQKRWPERPKGLRDELAKAIREAVMDSSTLVRLRG